MTIPCTREHTQTGRVTSHPAPGACLDGPGASTAVCDNAECIAEAIAWVQRMTQGMEAHYIPDGGAS